MDTTHHLPTHGTTTGALRLCVFCGARPNFIKVAPIIRAADRLAEGGGRPAVSYTLVYAGRADDPTLEDGLFGSLGIHRPDVCLGVVCENLNELTGQVMHHFEVYLRTHATDIVVLVDDLASTLAAAIVAKKQSVALAHIAAGTRSFDISMPKEINRLVIDGLADMLFTAGLSNTSIANREGAELSRVYMVGNILIDNIRYNRTRMAGLTLGSLSALLQLPLRDKAYIVFTLNRRALLADTDNLARMLRAMVEAARGVPIVAPLREPAAATLRGLSLLETADFGDFHLVDPMGYLEFSFLTAHALGIVTDSGNVAEEATFNSVPCITLNSYTEHIETVKVGSNVLVGEDAAQLSAAVDRMVRRQWKASSIPDRWDGRSAERILQTLINYAQR